MKKRILNTAIGLTALVASFLPQKVEACRAVCFFNSCSANWICFCSLGFSVCIDYPEPSA